jgi:hypothetical protein
MEDLSAWVAAACDSILQVNGDPLELAGVHVTSTDPSRGMDVNFALQTFHPVNVLAIQPDDVTCEEIFGCLTVDRFFFAGTDAPLPPEGWSETVSPQGVLYERESDWRPL